MAREFPSVHHQQLLREAGSASNETSSTLTRKRRKIQPEIIDVDASDEDSSDLDDDFEDVDLTARQDIVGSDLAARQDIVGSDLAARQDIVGSDLTARQDIFRSDSNSGESEDFENVDFTMVADAPRFFHNEKEEQAKDDVLTIRLQSKDEHSCISSKKGRVNFISREERQKRILVHKLYLVLMVTHLIVRNRWCNDKELGATLKRACLTRQIAQSLEFRHDISSAVGSRRLLDGLKKLLTIFASKYRVTSQGLIRKEWHELKIAQDSDIVTRKTFKRLVAHFRGSRDVAAQGFVTLLRSLGLNARLVFSLQPPDYTLVTETATINSSPHPQENIFGVQSKNLQVAHKDVKFEDSPYPIFWAEVFDRYKNTWISIDPIVMKTIDVCPKKKKSLFEPPATDVRNQLSYVLAVDKRGRVRDVTRRYSFNYNARTIKKRIEFRSEEDKEWYDRVLNYKKRESRTISDIYELKEFHERDLSEGMPNNIQAFRNHPIYALESQLKQNEVIYPKDKTSVCGTFRPKNSSGKLLDVYKRSCVKRLRSAKAWYMRGRVLKVGAMPMKYKKGSSINGEEEVRLYAEFQTKLYVPPVVEDGKVPKNLFGNIDIYTDSMIPGNCVLVKVNDTITVKMLQKTASLLNIDYATAIVSFDFTKRNRGVPNAKEGGIVILKDHEEAMGVSLEHVIEMEANERRLMVESNALQNWNYFLLKLRLKDRLNKSHGFVDEEVESKGEVEVEDDSTSEGDSFQDGGFLANDTKDNNRFESSEDEDEEDDEEDDSEVGGGFMTEDSSKSVEGAQECEVIADDGDEISHRRSKRIANTRLTKHFKTGHYKNENENSTESLRGPTTIRVSSSSEVDLGIQSEKENDNSNESSLEFDYDSD
ncbi:hypothetical protein KGF56_004314 [Candida oxycetoniae]|uniref:DNA repair protein RAD4 n=1 Tax=Candida oxycetoniae TaxID=497107 RepID=A0AAI9SU48_9ASCO|nr:uncharacterized protein KGF56_004314 [Candida oxycetoniae]KAI3402853.2 hypothetical protein KGF56_004314 [Candida oxycetoniae]